LSQVFSHFHEQKRHLKLKFKLEINWSSLMQTCNLKLTNYIIRGNVINQTFKCLLPHSFTTLQNHLPPFKISSSIWSLLMWSIRRILFKVVLLSCSHHLKNITCKKHVVSECNTAVYFSWCLTQALAQPVQLFWPLVTFSVASGNSLTDSD